MHRWLHRALSASLIVSMSSAALAYDAAFIDYRSHVMQTLDEQLQALTMTAQGKAPAENFKVHAEALALTARQISKSFEDNAPGGKAKPEIWSHTKEFSAMVDQFAAGTAEFAKLAKKSGVSAASKLKTLVNCQACHDAYMVTSPEPAKVTSDRPEIQYREHMMDSIDGQSAALGQILSGEIPDTNLASHLDVIALIGGATLKSFEPKVPGGRSKPAVWTNWADFSSRMNEFAQKSAAAAKVAKEQGNEAAAPGIVDALSCKGCHDLYRETK